MSESNFVTQFLSEDEFVERFQPYEEPEGGYVQYEAHNPEDRKLMELAQAENRLWTALEDDNGEWCLGSGFHFVNRLYYIICKVPFEKDHDYLVRDDPEEFDGY